MYAFQGGPVGERQSYVLDILSSVLGDGESSWLNQTLVKGRRPLLSSIYAANYTLQHNGVFFFGGELANGQSLNRAKDTLLKLVEGKMCNDAITERTVQKTKNQYLLSYFQSLKTNAGSAHFVGLRESLFGDYQEYKSEIAAYESITTDEVKQACKDLIAGKEGVFLSIWNKHPREKGAQ
jgi:zinc protease